MNYSRLKNSAMVPIPIARRKIHKIIDNLSRLRYIATCFSEWFKQHTDTVGREYIPEVGPHYQ